MKRLFVLLACLAAFLPASARNYRSGASSAAHYLRLSLGAGESNTFSYQGSNTTVPVADLPGMGADLGVGYELRRGRFLFGLDLDLDYSLTQQRILYSESPRSGYLDRALGADGSQVPVDYHYIFESFGEHQNLLRSSFHLYMGGNIGDRFYALGGLKMGAMLYASHRADIRLSTRKVYGDILLPEVEAPSAADGNYPSHIVYPRPGGPYSWLTDLDKGEVAHPLRLTLAPALEAGIRIPFLTPFGQQLLRIGLFGEWAVPLLRTGSADVPLVDYSLLESRIAAGGLFLLPDNMEQLDRSIRVNSLLNSEFVSHASPFSLTQLTVGIRLTFLLRMGASLGKCNCLSF